MVDWSSAVKAQLDELIPREVSVALGQRLMGLIDLTSLNESDTEATIAPFLEKAQTPLGHVAAVCVYPRFVRMAATQFIDAPVKVATVANFPGGVDSLDSVLISISRSLEDGADEIDVVFPFQQYLVGERQVAQDFIAMCKAACGKQVMLKVILETGAYKDLSMIASASEAVFDAGADFIKTSTGKIAIGATLEAAAVMLLKIKQLKVREKNRQFGFKVSGGIRDMKEAAKYLELADKIMGQGWVTPDTFRIGTSKLVEDILIGIGGNI